MSRFAWQPPTKLRLGEDKSRPRTAPDLLRDLGVSAETDSAKRQAVNGWLVAHPPDELMQTSLRRRGLPTAPLSVSPTSHPYVRVLGCSATIVTENRWRETELDLFPRRRVSSHYVFNPTVLLAGIVGPVGDLANDPLQPERKRDGVLVS